MTATPPASPASPAAVGVVFERVRLVSGHVLELTLQPGVHAFFADSHEVLAEPTLHEVCALLTGWRAPRTGAVRVMGQRPHHHPATRRRIASVLGVEPPLLGRTVGQHVERLTGALGLELSAEHSWLSEWRTRPSENLNGLERRAVAAAIALASPQPALAVLHEPLSLGAPFTAAEVLERIRHWQAAGVTIVCTTTDPRVITRLGAQVWSLARAVHSPTPEAEYLLRTSEARGVAARLAAHPAVTALRYDETRTRDLWVRGADLDRLAEAIQAAVLAEGCELHELTRLHRTQAPQGGEPAAPPGGAQP